jgi:hypothetical protein
MRKLLTWLRRLAMLAALFAVAQRVLRRINASNNPGEGTFPPIVGDTWPPVPTNPDRED